MSKAENSKKEKLKALKKAEKKMKKRKNHTAKKIAAGAGITVAVLWQRDMALWDIIIRISFTLEPGLTEVPVGECRSLK